MVKLRHIWLAMLIKMMQKISPKEVVIGDKNYIVSEKVFNPKRFYTSELMLANMQIKEGSIVLDMGTGSGVLAIEAAKKASVVFAADISKEAIKIARENAELNGINNIEFIQSDLFSSLPHIKFDIILFNPPYLDLKPKSIFDYAICDYKKRTIKRFLKEAKDYLKEDGHIEIAYSSIADPYVVMEYAKNIGWKIEKIAEKKIPGEKLYVFKLIP
ncbi:MAG: methyltransferase [Thermoplasmata archaeon]|nr:MAG: methyltransferase [Thermoplasmata archaeon]